MSYFTKKKSYQGRWIVKLIEATLIMGIVFFTMETIVRWTLPETQSDLVTSSIRLTSTQYHFGMQDYHRMGDMHAVYGNYYEAIEDYQRALDINPNYYPMYLNIGVMYEYLENPTLAMNYYATYLSRDNMQVVDGNSVYDGYEMDLPMVENRMYRIPIEVEAGQTVTIRAQSSFQNLDALDPLLLLVDEQGRVVAGDDDTLAHCGAFVSADASIDNFTFTQSGTYILYMSHAGGQYRDGYMTLSYDVINYE